MFHNVLKNKLTAVAAIIVVGSMTGCAQKIMIVGADLDANGCRPSAGYAWCTELQSCQRPWELARENDFVNTPGGFDGFCKNPDKKARIKP